MPHSSTMARAMRVTILISMPAPLEISPVFFASAMRPAHRTRMVASQYLRPYP